MYVCIRICVYVSISTIEIKSLRDSGCMYLCVYVYVHVCTHLSRLSKLKGSGTVHVLRDARALMYLSPADTLRLAETGRGGREAVCMYVCMCMYVYMYLSPANTLRLAETGRGGREAVCMYVCMYVCICLLLAH